MATFKRLGVLLVVWWGFLWGVTGAVHAQNNVPNAVTGLQRGMIVMDNIRCLANGPTSGGNYGNMGVLIDNGQANAFTADNPVYCNGTFLRYPVNRSYTVPDTMTYSATGLINGSGGYIVPGIVVPAMTFLNREGFYWELYWTKSNPGSTTFDQRQFRPVRVVISSVDYGAFRLQFYGQDWTSTCYFYLQTNNVYAHKVSGTFGTWENNFTMFLNTATRSPSKTQLWPTTNGGMNLAPSITAATSTNLCWTGWGNNTDQTITGAASLWGDLAGLSSSSGGGSGGSLEQPVGPNTIELQWNETPEEYTWSGTGTGSTGLPVVQIGLLSGITAGNADTLTQWSFESAVSAWETNPYKSTADAIFRGFSLLAAFFMVWNELRKGGGPASLK